MCQIKYIIMESLDKYFFNLSQNCDNDGIGIEIDKGKIIQNYKKYYLNKRINIFEIQLKQNGLTISTFNGLNGCKSK